MEEIIYYFSIWVLFHQKIKTVVVVVALLWVVYATKYCEDSDHPNQQKQQQNIDTHLKTENSTMNEKELYSFEHMQLWF